MHISGALAAAQAATQAAVAIAVLRKAMDVQASTGGAEALARFAAGTAG